MNSIVYAKRSYIGPQEKNSISTNTNTDTAMLL